MNISDQNYNGMSVMANYGDRNISQSGKVVLQIHEDAKDKNTVTIATPQFWVKIPTSELKRFMS